MSDPPLYPSKSVERRMKVQRATDKPLSLPLCAVCRDLSPTFDAGPMNCAWCSLQDQLAQAEAKIRDAYAFIDDLLTSNPNIIGHSALQDYARFNRVMMAKDALASAPAACSSKRTKRKPGGLR